MLMITVTAFATSYTDKLTYKLTVFTALTKDLPAGELTIEPYGTSNYTVTAKGCDLSDFDAGNWDEIVCEDVAGTKDANGVTTITLDNPYAYRTSDNTAFTDTKLVVKFNGTKAYAHFEGKMKVMYVARAFEYTFGTDEGFDGGGSTGGGETGGEVAAPFEKVDFVGDGTNFDWKIPVNWDTQKIVMSIDPSTCTGNCEDIIGLGEVATAWNNTLHLYRKTDKTLQGYFQIPGGSNNNTNPFDETNPIKVEVSKAQGFVVNGVVKIPASQMSALFALSTVNMGTGEGANDKSRATYKYVKVVDKYWTEVPPVTVKDTKKFENVAYTTSMGGNGTATVTFTEMSDGTFPMTFVSDDLNVKAENLTKGTDEKGRTTYTGTAKRTDVDVTFTVKAVVYGETTAQKLYMTMDNGSSLVVTVGEDPDYVAPVTYKNTLKVVRGTDTKAYENAEVSVLAKGENKYAVTIPSFTDMDQMEGTIGKLTFEATGVEDGGTLKLTATSATTTQEGGTGWDAAAFTASMDATVTGETLAGTFTVVYPNDATNYTYTLYYGVEPPTTPEEPKDVTVVEKYQADGTGFSHTINVDWDKQKIVASIDFSNGGDDKDILAMTTGDSFTAFQTSTYRTMHWYCNQTDKQISGFFAKDGAGNNNTGRMDVADCLAKFEISKDEGLKVNGEVKMTPTVLEELLTGDPIIIGSGESPKFSNAFYNYIKVVSLDWKEPTEPEVTVKDEKTFNEALYMQDQKVADATVVVKEMSDETINMSLKFGENEYTSTELTKGTDTKGRTTYTGKVAKDAMTFDVAGVVYEKDNVSRLYMTMKATNMNIVVGENPDTEVQKPVVYKNTLKVVRGTTTQTYENAEVSVLAKGEGLYEVTLPKFSDMDNVPGEWGPITFQATGAEESGKVVLTATDQEFTLTNTGWKNDVVKVSMKGEIESEMLKATFNVNHSSMSGYNYTLYYGVEAPEIVTELSNKTYKSNLRIADQTSEDENAYLFQTDEATVNIIKYSDKTYKITLKQITLNSKTSDLVFTGKAVESEVDPGEGGAVVTEGTMVQATADADTQNFLGGAVNAQFMWQDVSDTEIRMSFSLEGKTLSLGGEFNYENTPEPPVEPTFPMENYQADGKGFVVSTDIDWSKQKFLAIIDATKCNAANTEDIFGFGAEATAWFKNIHVYADKGSYKAYFQPAAEKDNNNTTVTIADQSNITIEVSKAKGLTVDGVVVIAAEQLTGIFDLTTVKFGSGENSQYSNALYKSVKLVDLPKDPETGINAINAEVANGEAQLFTVNGVKLNKLQKGLNIVRTADGKVKKVLVK